MPDGMSTPEQPKSSIQEFMRAGPSSQKIEELKGPVAVTKLPGSEMPDTSKFQIGKEEKLSVIGGQEDLSVDLRMQLDGDRLKRLQEREAYERSGQGSEYDKGRSIEAVVARHPRPETVKRMLRALQLKEETFNTFGEPDNRWEVSHRVNTLRDRTLALKTPAADVVELDLARKLSDDELAEAKSQLEKVVPADFSWHNLVKPRHVDGFGLDEFPVSFPLLTRFGRDTDGNRVGEEINMVSEALVYLGKDDNEREKAAEVFDKLTDEVTARSLMMQLWNHHTTYYYALQKLAEGHYFATTLSSEGLGVLFNLEGQKGAATETVTKVPLRHLGDKIETAMRIYYVAALCEKPVRFRELMQSPGWKQYLFPDGTSQETIEEWIGKPEEWEDETRAAMGVWMGEEPGVGVGGHRTKETLRDERMKHIRGKFTRRNIFADATSETYAEAELHEAIEKFLGGGKGASTVSKMEAETARRIAFRTFRLLLLADQEGYELYEDPSKADENDPFKGLDISFENAPAASDFGKLTHPDLYAGKSQRKGRDYFPEYAFRHSREYYNRFMVDFLRHGTQSTKLKALVNGQEDTIIETRSLMERWWGYRAEAAPVPRKMEKVGDAWMEIEDKRKADSIPEAEIPQITYLDERAVRLGDLPWKELVDSVEADETTTEITKLPEGADKEKYKDEDSIRGIPVGGYHFEAYKTLWLTGFMFGGENRAHAIISQTGHNPQELMDVGWWRKFWKMLDVGVRDGVAMNGEFRGKTKDDVKKAKDELKVNIIRNFVIGLQGLPEWEEWDRKQIEIYPIGGDRAKTPLVTQRIIEVANLALKEERVNYRTVNLEDLLQNKIDSTKKRST